MRADPRDHTLHDSPQRLPGATIIQFPRRYRFQRGNAEANHAVYLDQAIAILSESKCVDYQSKQLLRRALAIRDRFSRESL